MYYFKAHHLSWITLIFFIFIWNDKLWVYYEEITSQAIHDVANKVRCNVYIIRLPFHFSRWKSMYYPRIYLVMFTMFGYIFVLQNYPFQKIWLFLKPTKNWGLDLQFVADDMAVMDFRIWESRKTIGSTLTADKSQYILDKKWYNL